jgi:hypothetical protein
MFRLYLTQFLYKISSKSFNSSEDTTHSTDRRVYERFEVKKHHLTMINKQDIFLIKNISQKGLASEVSPRSYQNLKLGNVYKGKIRYLDEIYTCNVSVQWKQPYTIGFYLIDSNPKDVFSLFKRLTIPIKIGQSLKKTSHSFPKEIEIYKGDFNTTLCFWTKDKIKSWILITNDKLLQWDGENILAGTISTNINHSDIINTMTKQLEFPQYKVTEKHRRLAKDIILASHLSKDKLNIIYNI